LAEEKEEVRASGGLYVMGTNRHESSRIDNQLRGRAGRQGDTGTSRFFLSFEDDMFVIFGGDSLEKILAMFRVSEDMPVEAPQVTDALDKVQSTVEEKYRNIRREVFKFDEVLNGQRRVIYNRRRKILFSSPEESLNMMKKYNEKTVADIVKAQTANDGTVNVEKVLEKIGQFFPPVRPIVQKEDVVGLDQDSLSSYLSVAVDEVFNQKVAEVGATGRSANYIALVTMDNAWSDHLQSMENLKESVVLRQYEGRDPVAEYENEAFKFFLGLEDTMRFNAVFSLWQSFVKVNEPAAQAA
jgi:preprotein translocase subunit SecA